jgi:hypothetical protein
MGPAHSEPGHSNESTPLLTDAHLEAHQPTKKQTPLPRAQLAALCISRLTDPIAYTQVAGPPFLMGSHMNLLDNPDFSLHQRVPHSSPCYRRCFQNRVLFGFSGWWLSSSQFQSLKTYLVGIDLRDIANNDELFLGQTLGYRFSYRFTLLRKRFQILLAVAQSY